MRHENVWLVSDSAVMAAVTDIAKSECDALASCLVVFSVQIEMRSKSKTIATFSYT